MRRKTPMQNNGGGYNNQHKKPRFASGAGGGERQHNYNAHGNNRPRKNYGAMREKYLAQARDALASGDRVLAENYFQHADHCYRMMMEEMQNQPRPRYNQHQQAAEEQPTSTPADNSEAADEVIASNANPLPAFLTVSYQPDADTAQPEQPTVHWEE